MKLTSALVTSCLVASTVLGCRKAPPPPEPVKASEWELLASELPSALLSIGGRSANDIYAVGADKGKGPLVLHFDGKGWAELHTGTEGDLWWVQALSNGPVFFAGAGATILRYDGHRFEKMAAPAPGPAVVYGVWASDPQNVYAVGNTAGHDGFIWRSRGGAFESEVLPADLPRLAGGAVTGPTPGFFKVFGMGDDVWVVGAGGTILHRKGAAPFVVVPSPTKDTLVTLHGVDGRVVAVGGSGNGVLLDGTGASFHDASPVAAGLLQGVFATAHGDWASGERAMVYSRSRPDAPFKVMEHGLELPASSSLHSVFVDGSGGVWSVGGNVLSTALDNGMLIHFGAPVPTVVIDDGTP